MPMNVNRPREASYAGIHTFSKVPLVLDPADLAGGGAAIDETVVVRPGARYGPLAIRVAGYGGGFPNMDLGVSPFDELNIVDYGDAEIVPAGAIPVVLGGDHSIAHPDVGAVAEALHPEPIGLVHFDAHADDAKDI